jgi:hypothetical protein
MGKLALSHSGYGAWKLGIQYIQKDRVKHDGCYHLWVGYFFDYRIGFDFLDYQESLLT